MLTRLYTRIVTLLNDREGASAVEYGILVAGIAAVVVVGVYFLGTEANSTFNTVGKSI